MVSIRGLHGLGPEIKSSKRASLRGLWAGPGQARPDQARLQVKLYCKSAYKTSNDEKVIYATNISV